MLSTPESIDRFKIFHSKGGIKKPDSYMIAVANVQQSKDIHSTLFSTVDYRLDYSKDGIQELPSLIAALSHECVPAKLANESLINYIDMAATPSDLMQVAGGVDILLKLSNTNSDQPAASIGPIVDMSRVNECKTALDQLSILTESITALMSQINSAITPPTPLPPPAPVLPAPALPENLKTQAIAMISRLSQIVGVIENTATNITEFSAAAAAQRIAALDAFNSAIDYTIIEANEKNNSIKDAIAAISPV